MESKKRDPARYAPKTRIHEIKKSAGAEYIGTVEAGAILGVNPRFLAALARKGQLAAEMMRAEGPGKPTRWYFRRSDIESRLARPPATRWKSDDPDSSRYVTVEQAMELLNVSRATIMQCCRRGQLQALPSTSIPIADRTPHMRLYFRRREIDAMLRSAADELAEWDREDVLYFAGLFDGEGTVGIGVSRSRKPGAKSPAPIHTLHIALGNTCFDIVDWIHRTFGGTVVTQSRAERGWSPCKVWTVQGERAARLLRAILPRLISKREQALLGIEFRDHVAAYHAGPYRRLTKDEIAWREGIRQKVMALNNRFLPKQPSA